VELPYSWRGVYVDMLAVMKWRWGDTLDVRVVVAPSTVGICAQDQYIRMPILGMLKEHHTVKMAKVTMQNTHIANVFAW
jgi:hypothetical protein